MMKRMKIPLANIRAKIRDTEGGRYTKEDIDLFADEMEIKEANFSMVWNILRLIFKLFNTYKSNVIFLTKLLHFECVLLSLELHLLRHLVLRDHYGHWRRRLDRIISTRLIIEVTDHPISDDDWFSLHWISIHWVLLEGHVILLLLGWLVLIDIRTFLLMFGGLVVARWSGGLLLLLAQ